MVALGAYVTLKKIIPLKKLIEALRSVLPAHHYNLLPLNEKALREGAKIVKHKNTKRKNECGSR
jgi:Pyruvate/2-oxoacid:ferredoxin oxidoreductase gamma subunit